MTGESPTQHSILNSGLQGEGEGGKGKELSHVESQSHSLQQFNKINSLGFVPPIESVINEII